jgi:hypothetical protein
MGFFFFFLACFFCFLGTTSCFLTLPGDLKISRHEPALAFYGRSLFSALSFFIAFLIFGFFIRSGFGLAFFCLGYSCYFFVKYRRLCMERRAEFKETIQTISLRASLFIFSLSSIFFILKQWKSFFPET